MPWVYIYTPDMFVTGLPAENSSGNMTGSLPMTVTLRSDARPILVEIRDTDGQPGHFSEVTTQQTIGQPVTSGSTTYPVGTKIQAAYNLSNAAVAPGLTVSTFRFGNDGYDAGPVQGLVATQALIPGQSYAFRSTVTSNGHEIPYANLYGAGVPCFVAGTLIATVSGPNPVEDLRPGARILTRDHGVQVLRWIGRRSLSAEDLAAAPPLRPIRIAAGALGAGLPLRDLTVSPQHRMLIRSAIARRMFDRSEVLVAARHLLGLPGITQMPEAEAVTYLHLMFDRHEIIFAEGAETESLYSGPQALRALDPEARAELITLFPDLACPDFRPAPSRLLVSGHRARTLARRHGQSGKPLASPALSDNRAHRTALI